MSSQSVIAALKQKLLNVQKESQNQAPQQGSPYSRSRREAHEPSNPPVHNLKPSSSGSLAAPSSNDSSSHQGNDEPRQRDTKGHYDSRENRENRGNRDSRSSRYESGGYQRRVHYQRNVDDRRDIRSSRDSRDSRGSRDSRDSRDLRDSRNSSGPSRDGPNREPSRYKDYQDRGNFERGNYERGNSYRERGNDDRRYRERGNDDRRYRERDSRRYREEETQQPQHYDRRGERSSRNEVQFSLNQADLATAVSLDELPRKSFWDVKPKGFENVSSEKAKISGLFPLPGEARRIDVSKLEGLVKSGDISSQASILFEETKIDSSYSRISRQLIVTGVEFTLFPVERLVESLKTYIASLGLEESYLVNHELFSNKQLVLHLSTSNLTTVLYASELYLQKELNLKLKLNRPQSYITPIPEVDQPNKTNDDGDQEEVQTTQPVKIKDNEKKISILNVPTDLKEDELISDLEEIDQINLIDWVKSSKGDFTGIVFVEFKNLSPESIIEAINKIVINQTTLFSRPASKGLLSQESNISYRSFAKLVQNKGIDESSVLILLNAIDPESLRNEQKYNKTYQDIQDHCSTYGTVESIKIPKPKDNYKRNLKNLHTNVGKIFVKFSKSTEAQTAAKELHGKRYIERTILVSFISESDYELNIL